MEENGTYSAAGMLWDYSCRSVKVFNDGGGIGMANSSGANN